MRLEFSDNVYRDLMRRRNNYISGIRRKDNIDLFRHMAAVVSQSGEIIATGYNNVRPNRFSTIHAEQDAIAKAAGVFKRKHSQARLNKSPPKVTLVVIRDNGMNSRPCYNCITDVINQGGIFNISRIWYSHEMAATGLIETTPQKLFQSRFSHISKFNARRMGLETLNQLEHLNASLTSTDVQHDHECCDGGCDASEESDEDSAEAR